MLFNSWEFALLVFITFFIYYLPFFRRIQPMVLILSSFVFYAYNNPVLILLLTFSILLFAFFSSALCFRVMRSRALWLYAGIITALVILGSFKYGPLIVTTFMPEWLARPGSAGYMLATLPLPIGISFFTFEGISLIVDTFRTKEGRAGVTPFEPAPEFRAHLRDTALFISFFPHLVAGPIIKAHQFFPQIEEKSVKSIDWSYAYKTITMGYFLKMVIADNLKDHTFWIAYPHFQAYSSLTLLTMLYGFSMQIFADFAGYSLIAIGVASLYGYKLPINFNFPYVSASFSEFWRRWHISLSSWLKSYLYIPLGGNRRGLFRVSINILIVMFLGGLWHGAKWSFALWGLWHGFLLLAERLARSVIATSESRSIRACKVFFVFTAVSFSWLLFKLQEFDHVLLFLKSLLENGRMHHNQLAIGCIAVYSLPVVLYHAFYLLRDKAVLRDFYLKLEPFLYGFLLFLIIFNSGSANEFIYFQF